MEVVFTTLIIIMMNNEMTMSDDVMVMMIMNNSQVCSLFFKALDTRVKEVSGPRKTEPLFSKSSKITQYF